jgi:hypothetical protein
MAESMKAQERIVIMIDPFTRRAELYNFTTCKSVEVDGLVDIQPNEKNEVVVKIDASFTLKGLVCKFADPEDKKSP